MVSPEKAQPAAKKPPPASKPRVKPASQKAGKKSTKAKASKKKTAARKKSKAKAPSKKAGKAHSDLVKRCAGELEKFLLLLLPGPAEVAGQVGVLAEFRIHVSR